MLVRQLEEELRMRMRNPSVELQQQMEMLFGENEHLTREIAILRETIKVGFCLVTSGASQPKLPPWRIFLPGGGVIAML